MVYTAHAKDKEHGKTIHRCFEQVHAGFIIVEEDEGSKEGDGAHESAQSTKEVEDFMHHDVTRF